MRIRKRVCFAGFIAVLLVPASGIAGALFRYRSYTGTKPAEVSALKAGGNISHSAMPAGDVTVIPRGTSFTSWNATDFDGASEYAGGQDSISTLGANSDDSFSIESVFNARASSGQIKLISNTQNNQGFCLRIIDGRLTGLVRLKNGSSSIDLDCRQPVSDPVIALNSWHRAIFTVERQSAQNRYRSRLYLDGTMIAEAFSASLYNGVFQCNEAPMVGAEPDGGTGTQHFFNGQIESAVIRQGTLPPEYLVIDGPRDGSPNLGFPNYPESLGSTAENLDKLKTTLSRFPNWGNVSAGFVPVPLLNDNYIPQGCASDNTDNFFISYYWKAPGGATGDYPSIIAQVGFDGRLRRVIQLLKRDGTMYTGHVGGCAYFDGKLYIPRDDMIFRYDLDDLPNPGYVANGDAMTNIRADQNAMRASRLYDNLDLKGNGTISFMEVGPGPNNQSYLWLGQWDSDAPRRLLGFALNASGDPASTPAYNFKLWRNGIQGIAAYRVTASEISFYGTSNPGGDGTIFAADYPLQATAEATVRPVRTVGKGPYGIEDLALVNGDPWTVSESASRAYQIAGPRLDDFWPFIYGMKGETSRVENALKY